MRLHTYARAATMLAFVASPLVAQKRAITFEDFAAVRAVSDPQVSPDGRWVLYSERTTDVEANRRTGFTYLVSADGGAARRFPDDSTRASEARWSPDGRSVAYVANDQLWVAATDGSSRRQVTALSGGATGPVWAPTGDRIAFVSGVYPDCSTDDCNAQRDKQKEENKVK
ncbi:MAG: TolB family protein, partial [Gemmatimonadaceae bacterium]